MIYVIFLILHVLISVALVLVILAQSSKGGLDANLGGAAMNVFGGSGASQFLKKWTQILGLAFLGSCLLLAFLVKDFGKKGISADDLKVPAKETPAQPAPTK